MRRDSWLAFVVLVVFYGWLDWALRPGRLDPVSLPPAPITGLLLIDTAWVGDWATIAVLTLRHW